MHMHCTQCDYHWCWICGRPISGAFHVGESFLLFIRCEKPLPNCWKQFCFTLQYLICMILMPVLVWMALSSEMLNYLKKNLLDRLMRYFNSFTSRFGRIMICLPKWIILFALYYIFILATFLVAVPCMPFALIPGWVINSN